MISVQFMKPFYTKVSSEGKLRLVFAYQYFSIMKDEEVFHFIPIDGKEMIIDLETRQVENLSEVFVFQRGNRFVRLPLYQLLLVSNVNEYLTPILDGCVSEKQKRNLEAEEQEEFEADTEKLLSELEAYNIDTLIDEALDARDEKRFYELVEFKKKSEVVYYDGR